MTYNFKFIYPFHKNAVSVRTMLKELLIPRKWQHYLRIKKQILINQKYRNFNELVKPGDQVQIRLDFIETGQHPYPASGRNPQIIYEDENLLVINKVKGQKTHPNLNETDTALNDCATYLKKPPYIVHRLDMLTGGLLLVAKNPAVVPILNRQLAKKIFKRSYYAKVLLTRPIPATGTINLPIAHDPNDPRKRMVAKSGLKSVTHYQIIRQSQNSALLKVDLETGRTHQIRVHLASQGWPILGDPLYNPFYQVGENLQLNAFEMSLIKPFSYSKLTVKLK